MALERVTTIPATAHNALTCSSPAADTAATVTLTPAATECVTLGGLAWSYSADPSAAAPIVVTDGTITFRYFVTKGGPGFIVYDPPKRFPIGNAVTITAGKGGGSTSCTLDANAYVAKAT